MRTGFTALVILLLTACSPRVNQTPDSTQIASSTSLPVYSQLTLAPTQHNIPQMPKNNPTPTSEFKKLIEMAKEDLAQRLNVSLDSITVVAVIGQDFSTDAFYCRVTKERIAKEEGLQVISGQSILLTASGHRYEYHASDQAIIFCRPLP